MKKKRPQHEEMDPATPVPPRLPLPSSGGTYLRQPDGSLIQIDSETLEPLEAPEIPETPEAQETPDE